jgi:signal transduction histidine kinase
MYNSNERYSSITEQWQINKYLWICLFFLGVFIPLAHARGWMRVPLGTAFGILSVAAVNAAIRTYVGWKRGGSTGTMGWLFTTIDVGLISVGVSLTGGLRSELWCVYFVLFVAESLYAAPGQTNLLIGLIVGGYFAATWAERYDPDYVYLVAIRLFFLMIVGAFARRLSGNREARNVEVLRLSEYVAASEERAHIAREIHDSLGHALVSCILRLELCSRLIRKDPAEAEQILNEEVPALRAAWNEGRNLAFHLRPWEAGKDGLGESLRKHVSRFAERTGMIVDLNIEEADWRLPNEVEMAATRIFQEALTNVARHAAANRVTAGLRLKSGELRGTITDDGVGFDCEHPQGAFGLGAMRERAEKLGGSFNVASKPDEGTTIEFAIPVPR